MSTESCLTSLPHRGRGVLVFEVPVLDIRIDCPHGIGRANALQQPRARSVALYGRQSRSSRRTFTDAPPMSFLTLSEQRSHAPTVGSFACERNETARCSHHGVRGRHGDSDEGDQQRDDNGHWSPSAQPIRAIIRIPELRHAAASSPAGDRSARADLGVELPSLALHRGTHIGPSLARQAFAVKTASSISSVHPEAAGTFDRTAAGGRLYPPPRHVPILSTIEESVHISQR